MFAVIRAGGKQFKVSEGDVIDVERLNGSDDVEFPPVLVVDDKGKARASASELSGATVTGKVLGESKGPKVRVAKFKSKSGYRRRLGHRQRYSRVQIESIKVGGRSRGTASKKKEGEDDGT